MPEPTRAPADLDASARALYYRLRKFLKDDFKTWHDGDSEALAQTCRWSMRARQAREGLPKGEDGRPVMHTRGRSENSGDVAHPLVRIAEAAERSFMDGLKELGFTPAARRRLQIESTSYRGPSKFGFDDPFEGRLG